MDEPNRGALMLVGFVAAALILMGVVEITLNWAQYEKPRWQATISANAPANSQTSGNLNPADANQRHTQFNFWSVAPGSVLCLAGIAMLVKSQAIANWVSEMLE
jgi:hypothetical protein